MSVVANWRVNPLMMSGSLNAAAEGVEMSWNHDAPARLGSQRGKELGQVSDEELLVRYRDGNVACFARLVERYQRELFHFLIRFLGDRAAAEDVFQETFLQVHQSAADFDAKRRFRPWLFTISANKARDMMRAQARRPGHGMQGSIGSEGDQAFAFLDFQISGMELPTDALERQEMAERVRLVILQMPDSLREILLLCYFEQFPYKQIGQILQIPLGTVKSRLHTAVADFANRWKIVNNSAVRS